MAIVRAEVKSAGFNPAAALPYELRLRDVELAMQDIYDLLFDVNASQVKRGLDRVEEIARPAVFSGLLSDALTKSVAKHSRALADNRYHNGHPDLVPRNIYPNNAIRSGDQGVEVKVTRGSGGVDAHGARRAWLMVFRYAVDSTTEPVIDRRPTHFTEVLLAPLDVDDFRRNDRGPLGTRTASPNEQGLAKLRGNWVYRDLI